MKKNSSMFKKAIASVTVAAMSVSLLSTSADAFTGFTGDYERSERLPQPSSRHEFAADELGVVNFETTWGDKAANIASMDKYIEEADAKGTKILLFPEMCVTGYVSSSNPDSEEYKMAVENAEELDGPTAKHFAEIADEEDMWIIYGAPQTIEGDDDHAYNSAFICSPEGEVTAYQKITPVEGAWCVAGDTPVIIDAGEYGKLGISICYDTYSTPEIERYYAAMGCNLLLNPTATGGNWAMNNVAGWEEYYKLRLESIASREGFTVMSSDLVGMDGNTLFPGGSIIMGSGPKYYAGAKDADGTTNTEAEIIVGEEGLLTNVVALTASSGSTCSNQDFNPEMYVDLYAEAAAAMTASGGALRYQPTTTDGPKTAVVNMTGYWGNKTKTVAKMKEYIEEAHDEGVEMIVFPETVLSGYGYVSPEEDPFYHKFGVSMQVATAETIPGATTNDLSTLAQEYGMYIIFGMTEKDEAGPIYDETNNGSLEGKVEKVYNSAAILYPNGKIDSYQKIHRAGYESRWSVCGSNPKMIDTEWGKIGIDICRDGHFYPELGRYYAAMGCTMFVHPTATTGNAWYRSTRIASYTDRDGMAAVTCNLLGGDGIYTAPGDEKYDPTDDEANFDGEGNFIGGSEIPDTINNQNAVADDPYWDSHNWTGSGGVFNSTSFIATMGSTSDQTPAPRVNYNNTGAFSEGFAERGNTSPLGLEIADMNLRGTGFSRTSQTFNPELFSKMYDKLATLYRGGYTSVYGEDAVNDFVTIDLTVDDETTPTPTATTDDEATPTPTTEASATPVPTVTPSVSPSVSPTTPTTPAVKASTKNATTKIKAAKPKVTVKKGKKATLKFTVTAKTKSKKTTDKMTVSIKNKKIVSVTKKSLKKGSASITVKGKKKGSTTVTVKVGKKSAKVTVKVK